MAAETTGASFTAVTFSTNVSETLARPSDAVTFRSSVPTKFAGGVPENVRVAASNVSHDGSADPSPSVAL